MTAVDLVLSRLKSEEGFRSLPYRDTQGHLTVGYGFNVDAGITQAAAEALLVAQATELHQKLSVYRWYGDLDPARQAVCLDIAFNAGLAGLLHYPRMIAALEARQWEAAASECTTTTPGLESRYEVLANILRTGSLL